jgi:hypothetical protein
MKEDLIKLFQKAVKPVILDKNSIEGFKHFLIIFDIIEPPLTNEEIFDKSDNQEITDRIRSIMLTKISLLDFLYYFCISLREILSFNPTIFKEFVKIHDPWEGKQPSRRIYAIRLLYKKTVDRVLSGSNEFFKKQHKIKSKTYFLLEKAMSNPILLPLFYTAQLNWERRAILNLVPKMEYDVKKFTVHLARLRKKCKITAPPPKRLKMAED